MTDAELSELDLGQKVVKVTGDYQASGLLISKFWTSLGKLRAVVEHDNGMLHIYSAVNLIVDRRK